MAVYFSIKINEQPLSLASRISTANSVTSSNTSITEISQSHAVDSGSVRSARSTMSGVTTTATVTSMDSETHDSHSANSGKFISKENNNFGTYALHKDSHKSRDEINEMLRFLTISA